MGGGETPVERRGLFAALLTFFFVIAFQLLSKWLDQLKKKGSRNTKETELRSEIKQLLKEASALSQPSTFARAAKLRRLAAAKEKELSDCQKQHNKEIKVSHDLDEKVLFVSKGAYYLGELEVTGTAMCWLEQYHGWYCLQELANMCVDLSSSKTFGGVAEVVGMR